MPATMIDGKGIAAQIREACRLKAEELKTRGIEPCLAVVLVGDDPASQVYVRNKENACKAAGIRSLVIRLQENSTQNELEQIIRDLNADAAVHGILVQLPLPKQLDEKRILNLIDPNKDVDGFHPVNMGSLLTGESVVAPCTPLGVMELLRACRIQVEGKHAVIVGRSNIVGKPMAALLLAANATVTVCHSRTKELEKYTKDADILVAAVGKPHFIKAEMVKPGAVVIDVGINRVDGKLMGDVDTEAVAAKAGWVTPVPGGVGPMTIAMLLFNTLKAAENHAS
ncbi:MAG: bifunctional methylenetetrahydrofolate dehydrogenase/methenyltetrahydrofolate cyclohydrolase FolD [Clostridia bacterium]|nr:bifunctional methylenetetrahydrofolate dehydrogenase/methenyltetrahydrofolate cyclohydrolase FolD [Clostridia bacterium]